MAKQKLLEEYIVERLKSLENEVKKLNEDYNALREKLANTEKMKEIMQKYFCLREYADGALYIDHSYKSNNVTEIAEFIGLTNNNEEEDDENV